MFSVMRPFDQEPVRRLMVFGHPGHELAVFGLLQRYRPDVIVITDGGSVERVEQSRNGLASIQMLDQATYLNYREPSFYQALLDGDFALFDDIAARLHSTIATSVPVQVFCDAIEFYNPVHDITLPIVMRAVRDRADVSVYEVPLVYQTDEAGEAYAIQRVPRVLSRRRILHELSRHELDLKIRARDHIYTSLHTQAGPEFLALPSDHLKREELAVAGPALPSPAETGRTLRYEWRAQLLREQGLIEREITLARHFAPAVTHLLLRNLALN